MFATFSIGSHFGNNFASRSMTSDVEKLVYFQQSLKDGAAKGAIEGVSRSRDQYVEAVECLNKESL